MRVTGRRARTKDNFGLQNIFLCMLVHLAYGHLDRWDRKSGEGGHTALCSVVG